MGEQVVVDILDALELLVRLLLHRAHQVRVQSVEALDVGDELEPFDPFVRAQKIEIGGADEIDRCLVPVEEAANVADAPEDGRAGFLLSRGGPLFGDRPFRPRALFGHGLGCCLLYTSDAADERSSVDLGGRRIIKKKKNESTRGSGRRGNI